jgi:molybdenum cofactor cytidylyltransferase
MPDQSEIFQWQGILLAAGRGLRFDASGARNKLLQLLPSGLSVARSSASHLSRVLPNSLAVVSESSSLLDTELRPAGCRITYCADARDGMANSLLQGLRQSTPDCKGWVIALADMPFVRPESIAAVVLALQQGAGIAVPVFQGQRGNPVGFSRQYLPQLLALTGDQGARSLLKMYPVTQVEVDDPGILKDIDLPDDLPLA